MCSSDLLDLQAASVEIAAFELEFEEHFREDLMRQAWEALDRHDADSGKHYADLLRKRTTEAKLSSAELAEAMAQSTGTAWTAALVDKTVHRARRKFADLLLDGVARTLPAPGRAEMEQELADLELLEHCRDAVERCYASGE